MKRIFMKTIAFCILLMLALYSPTFGQGTASRVTGTVTDPNGAIVPGATVILTNEGNKIPFTTETTSSGAYVFDSVQVGTYTITVQKTGFKKFVSAGNVVNVNQPATVDVVLQTGDVTETITVNGAAELVQTSSSGNFGNTVEQRTLEELPIVGSRGRNPLQFINFQPGVNVGSNTGGGVHVNGARDRAFNFTLDGIDINESSAGGSNFTPLRTNPDSISEFQVVTSNFTAELGRSSGAQVTLVTRSGTNEFHGTAFEFYQTPGLNANEYQNNLNGVPRGQFVQHIFGGSLGGPVYFPRFGEGGKSYYNGKNKTFFFTNLQLLRAYQGIGVTNLVYTQQARQGIFRYVVGGVNTPAGAAGASVDASGNPLPGLTIGTYNVVTNDPRCKTAPTNCGLDPSVQQTIALTPLPNNFSVGDGLNTAGFSFVAPSRERQYDFAAKIDHNFNDRNSMYVRYAQGNQNSVGDNANGGLQSFPGLPNQVDTFRNPKNLAVNYRWTPTGTITNEFVVGFNRYAFSFNNPDPNFAQNPPYGLNLVTNPLNNTATVNNARRIRTYQLVDNLSYVRGAHTYKTGVNFRYNQHLDDRTSVAGILTTPIVDFSTSVNTVDPATFGLTALTGINLANDRPRLQSYINDLLGRVGTTSLAFVAANDTGYAPAGTRFLFDARYPELDLYGQDTWKFRPNLTIDYGLRWEARLTPRSPNLILHPDSALRLGETPRNDVKFVPGQLFKSDYNNFAPSVGFAYDPFKDGKTSIRANFRLAYDRMNTFLFSSTIYQSEPGLTLAVNNTSFGQAGGRLRDGLPVLAPPAGVTPIAFRQPPAFSTNRITVVDPALRSPKTYQWGLSVQREIGFSTVLELDYIGRRAVGLYGAYDVNQVDIFNNGFLNAFNAVRAALPAGSGSAIAANTSPFLNQLLATDTRLRTGETGSQLFARLFESSIRQGSVASTAASIATRLQNGVPVFVSSGFSPFLFQPYPQFNGGVIVLDSNDFSTYHGFIAQVKRRFNNGVGFQASYTLSKSLDTRSFDPTFSVVSRANAQSASSTPFDLRNRKLNYARSDFDRRHVFQANFVAEVPFGKGRRFGSDLNPVVDRIIGGFETAGIVIWESGRPFTVYSGINTVSNINQSPASCTGCTPDMGFVQQLNGTNYFFSDAQRAQFFAPPPGQLGNLPRNFFTAPPYFELDLTLAKRFVITERQSLQLRAELQNATNTPSFDIPTATITSSVFGRIRGGVTSSARHIQLSLKYTF